MDECYPDFKVNKEHLPETMCIDEFKSVKNIDGAMSFVFADYQTKNIILTFVKNHIIAKVLSTNLATKRK